MQTHSGTTHFAAALVLPVDHLLPLALGKTSIQWTVPKLWINLGAVALSECAVMLLLGYSLVPLVRRYAVLPDYLAPLLSLAGFGLVALITFFAYLINLKAGEYFVEAAYVLSIAGLLFSLAVHRQRFVAVLGGRDSLCVAILIAIAFILYVALMYLPQTPDNFSELATRRGTSWVLPADNVLNQLVGERMAAGLDPRHSVGDWHTSDRPPLQTGVQLTCIPLAKLLHLETSDFLYPIAGALFQCGWICGAWALMRSAGCSRRLSMQLSLALIPSGFVYVNTIFVWAKLSAAGYSLGMLALLLPKVRQTTATIIFAAVCAVLAMLSHGGAFMFLLPMLLLIVIPPRWPGFKSLAIAGVLAILLYSPWVWYQKFYDPPGDRLVKMHLAGTDGLDPRSPVVVIREAYEHAGRDRIIDNKKQSFLNLIAFKEDWRSFLSFDAASIDLKRADIFFYTFPSLGVLNLGWPLILIAIWKKPWRQNWIIPTVAAAAAICAWCLIMFGGPLNNLYGTTVIHQGPYALQLLLMIVCIATIATVHRRIFAIVALLNAGLFFANYASVPDPVGIHAMGYGDCLAAAMVAGVTAAGLFLGFGSRYFTRFLDDAVA
jgi:hypothetical protein